MALTNLIASVGVLAALQSAYVFIKGMQARAAGAPPMWACIHIEDEPWAESEEAKMARELKQDFQLHRAKAIMSMAEQFAGSPSRN